MVQLPTDRFIQRIHPWGLDALRTFDGGCRQLDLVVHRGGHKSTLATNLLVREACRWPGRQYAVLGPYRVEEKRIIWTNPEMLFSYLPPQSELAWTKNEQDLYVRMPNGSLLYVLGADDPDRLRGLDLTGVVYDEWSKVKPELKTHIIDPMMMRSGDRWSMFIYTPDGQNHAYEQHLMAQKRMASDNPDWYAVRLPNSVTGILDSAEVERLRQQMPPAIFAQEIECAFVTDEERVLITSAMLDRLRGQTIIGGDLRTLITVDPASGGDECVAYAIRGRCIVDQDFMHIRDLMGVVTRTAILASKHQTKTVVVDVIGEGKGVADRLSQLGYHVIRFNSSEASTDERCGNRRAEAWWAVMELVRDQEVEYPADFELRKQLSAVHFKLTGRGQVLMELKEDVRKRIGRSPDRADAWVMGQWAMQFVPQPSRTSGKDGWAEVGRKTTAMSA